MAQKRRQNINDINEVSSDLFFRIQNENISDCELFVRLKNSPELFNSLSLFKMACATFRKDYIDCFIKCKPNKEIIINSNYRTILLDAVSKLLNKIKPYFPNRDALAKAISDQYNAIKFDIEEYLQKQVKTNKLN